MPTLHKTPVQRPLGHSAQVARPSILVVDDDAIGARTVMRAGLQRAGFEVHTASGREHGLRRFRAHRCDMIVLDVERPDLGGHEVCATLRAAAGPSLPIVMVTGMDDAASVEAAYRHGATDFIAKPLNWALIGHRVRHLLRSGQTLQKLGAEQARNAALLGAIPDLLFEVDIDGRFLDYRAPRAEQLMPQTGNCLGRTLTEVLPAAAARTCHEALHEAQVRGSSSGRQFELPMQGRTRWFELSVSPQHARAGSKPSFIVLSRDISERKDAELHIARLAYYDSLTGLPNRKSFLDRVDREVRRARRGGPGLAVLFMDLDGFKNVNDSLGHAAGDLVLQRAAERLREGLRPSDLLSRPSTVDDGSGPPEHVQLARLGGDEFTALLLDITRPEEAMAVASRIGQMMRRPFEIDGREVTLSTSVGIAIYPQDGDDAATLLKHADTAMYAAKDSGRDNAQMYSAALTREIVERMDLDASLRLALERSEFHLVYQPQIDPVSGLIHGVEALIRWAHPTRGLVSPLEFIPLAEQNGLINEIGAWALRTACRDTARWNETAPGLRVAVNLSPLQFAAPGLAQRVMDTLQSTGLAPHLLELEVTEGALMENSAATRDALQALRDRGVGIALDDFGTGYSSLAYLTRMPIGNIKVDKCFIAGLLQGGENEAIVRAVLAMAGSLGMRVTAEGVESLEQALALTAMACDSLQGYYFSRPVAAEQIPPLLSRRWCLQVPQPMAMTESRN